MFGGYAWKMMFIVIVQISNVNLLKLENKKCYKRLIQMSESNFFVGQKVDRIEDREVTGATILQLQIDEINPQHSCAEIQYDEGGSGWWPLTALTPKPSE